MIRVAIVDDKTGNRKVMREKLQGHPQLRIMLEAVDGQHFLDQLKQRMEDDLPQIVLMDLEMPVLDGTVTIATASSLYPGMKFVVLTIFDDDDKIFKAIRAGACGYLLKEESSPVIADMLMHLWENGAGPISPSIAYKMLQMVQRSSGPQSSSGVSAEIFQLSDREMEILQFLSRGLDYKEIGARLFISPHTVKKHCIHIYQKLHVNSKAQALRIAYTRGLID